MTVFKIKQQQTQQKKIYHPISKKRNIGFESFLYNFYCVINLIYNKVILICNLQWTNYYFWHVIHSIACGYGTKNRIIFIYYSLIIYYKYLFIYFSKSLLLMQIFVCAWYVFNFVGYKINYHIIKTGKK